MNTGKPNLGRHKRTCSVCRHKRCEDIEADFIAWHSPATIAKEYKLSDRSSVYRHARAFGLSTKRRRNVRVALERIIEKAGEVEVTATAVVAAIQAYAKISDTGQWIDKIETVNLNELFERMTREELESYARDGALPNWFTETLAGKKPEDSTTKEQDIYQQLFATMKDSHKNLEKTRGRIFPTRNKFGA